MRKKVIPVSENSFQKHGFQCLPIMQEQPWLLFSNLTHYL
uniref:Uncharacterized protein n=1 Tax=Anguilla anguilla TaxID=7936 RepID=A0A0E9XN44_ANGAN